MMGCSHASRCVSASGDRKGPFTSSFQKRRLLTLSEDEFVKAGKLGQGGFGEVSLQRYRYRCTRDVPHVWFAVKEMRKKKILGTKKGLQMLWGELHALKRLDHAFVVRLHFAFTSESSCFLGLDLLMGGDLRYYLMKGVAFTENEVSFITACMTSALQHIHSHGVIHRDIKPENIILDADGYPHLTDFGVAYVEQSDLRGNDMVCDLHSGTKQYLAPEVFTKQHRHGRETDLWSLGVTLYELLFRKRPFQKACSSLMVRFLDVAYEATGNYSHPSLALLQQYNQRTSVSRHTNMEATTTSEHDSGSSNDTGQQSPVSSARHPAELFAHDKDPVSVASGMAMGGSANSSVSGRVSPLKPGVGTHIRLPRLRKGGSNGGEKSTVELSYDHRIALQERLPHTLRVHVPPSSPHIGFLRADTVNFLERLLDIRPRLRIGAHRLEDIFSHHFIAKNFPKISKVLERDVSSLFLPNVCTEDLLTDSMGYSPEETRRVDGIVVGLMRPTGSFVTDPEFGPKSTDNDSGSLRIRSGESKTGAGSGMGPPETYLTFKDFTHQSDTFIRAAMRN